MLTDANKGATITYNAIGKPATVSLNGKTITYTFDGAGNKLKVATYDGTNTLTTDYVGGFVYEGGNLSYFAAPEGRVVKQGSNLVHEYAIADHQGNTRVVFTTQAPPAETYTATFEDNTQTAEQATFINYPSGANRKDDDLYDHTDSGTTFEKTNLLNGGYSSQVGLAKGLKVYPGDSIYAEVYVKYGTTTSNSVNFDGFATALAAAFGFSSSSTGEALKANNALQNFAASSITMKGPGRTALPQRPFSRYCYSI